ncbi:hypothetical protein BDV40DRAFT_267857 [Aspergillus tamarii]|uniref:Uncharacterized protein n=1 Tax=Aspergillus tamarii TaxID=41984 RepID=A0A5N6US08_ASPTM|nr:hypothetical protein BDV40DRAFT_267857 [Aspergillus tamarii]
MYAIYTYITYAWSQRITPAIAQSRGAAASKEPEKERLLVLSKYRHRGPVCSYVRLIRLLTSMLILLLACNQGMLRDTSLQKKRCDDVSN